MQTPRRMSISSLRVDFAAPNISQNVPRVKILFGDSTRIRVMAARRSLRRMRSMLISSHRAVGFEPNVRLISPYYNSRIGNRPALFCAFYSISFGFEHLGQRRALFFDYQLIVSAALAYNRGTQDHSAARVAAH